MTISGLCKVHKMSAGIVPPFSQKFGRSAKISKPSGMLLLRWVEKWLSTELCRQVNLPSERALGHQFSMCCKLLGFLHRAHLFVFFIPQRTRLSGVLRPFEHAFNVNDNTPYTKLFQVALYFSSIRSFSKSPWNVSFWTFMFQSSMVCLFTE